jgi:hypothetical protein
MTDIIETAARALKAYWLMVVGVDNDLPLDDWQGEAEAVLTAVTPLIRAQVLEEAAKVADKVWGDAYELRVEWFTEQIAASIRALKEQP